MKPRVALVTIGHVDHGKSTLLGRLLMEKGAVPREEIARYERQAALLGKASFKYAWVLDRSEESRARGLTLDLNYADFLTRNRKVHLIDAPGHQDFVRSMITGTTGADAALLVVDAAEGVMPQTREHAQLASAMGLRQVIVALNKIDRVAYDAARVAEAAAAVRAFLEGFGFDRVDIIPVSAWEGENLTSRSEAMAWYRGRTLEEAIDDLDARPAPRDGPLRLPAMDVLTIGGVGTVVVGRVERGALREGDEVAVEPSGKVAAVKSIELHGQGVAEAVAGDTVGVALRGLARADVARGDVLGPVEEPPVAVDDFEARVAITGDVGHAGVGWTPVLHCHAAAVPVRLAAVLARIDPSSGVEAPSPAQVLARGDVARVRFVNLKGLVIEGAAAGPALGRFALRLGRLTVGAGSCIGVTPHQKESSPGTEAGAAFSYKHQKTG
ncbi:MAG TPA: GTP-binding protein, partial [Candidatus Thermoplasmatota archaeon]|nr:GTP-binding protein [Candidatus Thermoplasmatota archaeon]